MVNDTEPRYRLVDANGTVVGTLFVESDGTLKLQEGTSGNDNELSLTTQGALEVEQILSRGQITTRDSGDKALHSLGNGFVGAAIESYRDSTLDKAILNLYAARGTESSPEAIPNNDRIGSLFTRGYDGDGFYITTSIITRSTEQFNDTAGGSDIVVRTTKNGVKSKSEAAIFDADFGVSIPPSGSSSQPAVEIGDNGAGFFVDGSGEVVVVDESGNTTTIS